MAQPSNDNCSGAITLTPVPVSNPGSGFHADAAGATPQFPTMICDTYWSQTGLDVFFKFVASQSSHIIKVDPSWGYDPAVFLYRGSCTSPVFMECSDDGGGNGQEEWINYNGFTPGSTYYIKVYDYDNTTTPNFFSTDFDIWVQSPNINGNADLSLNTTSVNFGNVQLGMTSAQTVTVTNNGNADLMVSNIDYNGSGFSGPPSLPVISPNGSFSLNLSFAPTSTGTVNGSATIHSNSSPTTDIISLSGVGSNVPSAQIDVSPGSLVFGSIQQGTSSQAQQIVISNTGNANLVVSQIVLPTGYTKNWSGGTISSGNSHTVDITFSPTTVAAYNGAIQVLSNSPTVSVPISGNGIAGVPTTITGNVKDIEVVYGNSTVVNAAIGNCTVRLKNLQGSVIATTTTNGTGWFSFSTPSYAPYKVEATLTDGLRAYQVGKNNVYPGSNAQILIPRKINNQIVILLDNLENNLQVHIEEYNWTRHVDGYNTDAAAAVLTDFSTFDDAFSNVQANLTRLYLSMQFLTRYYESAAEIGDEISKNLVATLGIIGRVFGVIKKFNKLTENSAILRALYRPALLLLEFAGEGAKFLASRFVSHLAVPMRSVVQSNLDYNIDLLIFGLDVNVGSGINVINTAVGNAVSNLTPFMVNRIYVRPTQQYLNAASGLAANLNQNYQYSNSGAIHRTKIAIPIEQSHASSIKLYMENLYWANDISQKIYAVSAGVSGILVLTGVGAAAVPFIMAFAEGMSLGGYACTAGATICGVIEWGHLKNQVASGINQVAFQKQARPSGFLSAAQHLAGITDLSTSIQEYQTVLQDVISKADYSQEAAMFAQLETLAEKHRLVNLEIQACMAPILAASPTLMDSLPSFQSIFSDQFMTPLYEMNTKQIGLYLQFVALISDTSNYSINTDIVAEGNAVIGAMNSAQIAITQFSNQTIGVPVPAYVEVVGSRWNKWMPASSSQTLTIKYKNYGNVALSNAYAKLTTTGGFATAGDSIYLGSIPAFGEDSLVYSIQAPSYDTTAGFEWIMNSDNGYGAGTGGVLSTNEALGSGRAVTNQALDFEVSPNPADASVLVSLLGATRGEVVVRVYDMRGALLLEDHSQCRTNQCSIELQTRGLAEGMYLVEVVTAGRKGSKKINVQHN